MEIMTHGDPLKNGCVTLRCPSQCRWRLSYWQVVSSAPESNFTGRFDASVSGARYFAILTRSSAKSSVALWWDLRVTVGDLGGCLYLSDFFTLRGAKNWQDDDASAAEDQRMRGTSCSHRAKTKRKHIRSARTCHGTASHIEQATARQRCGRRSCPRKRWSSRLCAWLPRFRGNRSQAGKCIGW